MSSLSERPALIALDWGTTSLRAWLVAGDGAVLDQLARPLGILAVEGGDFAGAFAATAGAWRRGNPRLPALASGMIGSRQGWREAPYVACPASADAIARGLVTLDAGDGGTLAIVPGLSCEAHGVPDVMRGEETQILGALDVTVGRALFVLPGTHSKWALVEDGRVMRFASFMTGEVFAVLSRHSILGRLMEGEAIDAEAFARGLAAGMRTGTPGSLLHRVFAARTLGLFAREAPTALRGYLSGLLIGAEVAEGLAWSGGGAPTIIGEPALAALYARALTLAGVAAQIGPVDAALRGLRRIALAAGMAH
jgi:2-dehydro-3-deoxygalactonokinase